MADPDLLLHNSISSLSISRSGVLYAGLATPSALYPSFLFPYIEWLATINFYNPQNTGLFASYDKGVSWVKVVDGLPFFPVMPPVLFGQLFNQGRFGSFDYTVSGSRDTEIIEFPAEIRDIIRDNSGAGSLPTRDNAGPREWGAEAEYYIDLNNGRRYYNRTSYDRNVSVPYFIPPAPAFLYPTLDIRSMFTLNNRLYFGSFESYKLKSNTNIHTIGGLFSLKVDGYSTSDWQRHDNGVEDGNLTDADGNSIRISTTYVSPSNNNIFYAGITGYKAGWFSRSPRGAFRSTDAGRTWQPINNGLDAVGILGVKSNRDVSSFVETGSCTPEGNILLVGTRDGGVFRSTNRGDTWTESNIGLGSKEISALVAAQNTVYAATASGGVYLSNNHGRTWTKFDDCIPNDGKSNKVNCLTLSKNYLFIGTDNGIFRFRHQPISYVCSAQQSTNCAFDGNLNITLHGQNFAAATQVKIIQNQGDPQRERVLATLTPGVGAGKFLTLLGANKTPVSESDEITASVPITSYTDWRNNDIRVFVITPDGTGESEAPIVIVPQPRLISVEFVNASTVAINGMGFWGGTLNDFRKTVHVTLGGQTYNGIAVSDERIEISLPNVQGTLSFQNECGSAELQVDLRIFTPAVSDVNAACLGVPFSVNGVNLNLITNVSFRALPQEFGDKPGVTGTIVSKTGSLLRLQFDALPRTTGSPSEKITTGELVLIGIDNLGRAVTIVVPITFTDPEITSFTPASAPRGGTVTIIGTQFPDAGLWNKVSGVWVTFGGEKADAVTVISATEVRAVLAGGNSGTVALINVPCKGTTSSPGFTFIPSISGTVLNAAGTTVRLYSGTGSSRMLIASVTTAANGSYTFLNVVGGTYEVQPDVPTCMRMVPETPTSVTVSDRDITNIDFTAFRLPQISGTVSGLPSSVPNVKVTLTGTGITGTREATVMNGANYMFDCLSVGGTYTVEPEIVPGYTVTPTSYNQTLTTADVANRNFVYAQRLLTVSGNVGTLQGLRISNVTVQISSAGGSFTTMTTTTGMNGEFSFQVPDNASYTVQVFVPQCHRAETFQVVPSIRTISGSPEIISHQLTLNKLNVTLTQFTVARLSESISIANNMLHPNATASNNGINIDFVDVPFGQNIVQEIVITARCLQNPISVNSTNFYIAKSPNGPWNLPNAVRVLSFSTSDFNNPQSSASFFIKIDPLCYGIATSRTEINGVVFSESRIITASAIPSERCNQWTDLKMSDGISAPTNERDVRHIAVAGNRLFVSSIFKYKNNQGISGDGLYEYTIPTQPSLQGQWSKLSLNNIGIVSINNPVPDARFGCSAIITKQTGGERIFVGGEQGLYYMDNNGIGTPWSGTWTLRNANSSNNIPIDFKGVQEILAHKAANNKTILFAATSIGFYRSEDEGLSWDEIPHLSGKFVFGLVGKPQSDIILVGSVDEMNNCNQAPAAGSLWRSSDAGLTWQPIPFINTQQKLEALRIASNGLLGNEHKFYIAAVSPNYRTPPYIKCDGGNLNFENIFKSNDDGLTWTATAYPSGLSYVNGLVASGDIIFAAGIPTSANPPRVFVTRSTDGGNSWEPISGCLPSDATLVWHMAINNDKVYVAVPIRSAMSNYGEVYEIDLCPIMPITQALKNSSAQLTANNLTPHILNENNYQENSITSKDILAFPNPVHDGKLEIKITVSHDAGSIIKFLDMQGKAVLATKETFYPKGSHNLQFDVSHLASGQYICVLESLGKRSHAIFTILR